MDDASAKVLDLIFGRWRSQILYAGVKLGVFDTLANGPRSAVSVASALEVDAGLLYRLMWALGSLELLHEDHTKTFSLTPPGELLSRDHPHTLRGQALLQEGPEHYEVSRCCGMPCAPMGNVSGCLKRSGNSTSYVTRLRYISSMLEPMCLL